MDTMLSLAILAVVLGGILLFLGNAYEIWSAEILGFWIAMGGLCAFGWWAFVHYIVWTI